MAQIPREHVDNFTKAINTLSADVQAKLSDALSKVDMSDVAAARDAIIDIMELYLGPYTDMAAILAAEFYDGLREQAVGAKLGAYAESGREPVATEKAVRGIMQDVVEGKAVETVARKLLGRADYEIKRSAGECVYRNGKRDPLKPKYARVPSGSETCRFCIMLASRGFVYRNEKAAGGNGHYHANCDCRIVPGFDGETTVAGYDPNAYYEQYRKMLEGHELDSHYDLLTRNGRTTKRMYKTAEYDYSSALGVKKKSGRSAKYATYDGTHDFKTFDDVKQYVYGATSKADMEHRYSVLGNLYGFDSEQMRSTSMKNAFRHVEKRYDGRKSIGAVYNEVFAERDAEVAKANLDKLKQTQLVHIAGSKQSVKTAKDRGIEPSCFTMSEPEVHALIKKHAGHGEPDALYENRWNRKEICTSDSVVGYIINERGDRIETRKFKIHYADDGVHAVPRYDDGGEPDDVG